MWHGIRTRCLLWFPLTHPPEPGAATSLPAPAGLGLAEPGPGPTPAGGLRGASCRRQVSGSQSSSPLYFPSVSELNQYSSSVTHPHLQLLALFTPTQPRPNLWRTASNASSYRTRAEEDLGLKKLWDKAVTQATRRLILLLQSHSKS